MQLLAELSVILQQKHSELIGTHFVWRAVMLRVSEKIHIFHDYTK